MAKDHPSSVKEDARFRGNTGDRKKMARGKGESLSLSSRKIESEKGKGATAVTRITRPIDMNMLGNHLDDARTNRREVYGAKETARAVRKSNGVGTAAGH